MQTRRKEDEMRSKWVRKHDFSRALFWLILLAAFLMRIIGLTDVPGGVNQDEAMAAVDAWALSRYGTDRYGMRLPVHFTAWRYGQMSVLLSYCMVPFIRLFGFSTFAIRLPMVLAGTTGVALMYLIGKRLFSQKWGIAVMALTAVNPWQFMQSRWSLDCNLFPHVFLLGFYLLLLGLEKRRYLYLSMLCFGLTFYCYGVAIYTVPVFLLTYAAWCVRRKRLPLRELLISALLFLVVVLPETITMAVNLFGLNTVETPLFTMPFFPDSVRSRDILFFDFSIEQLRKNVAALWNQVFLQKPDWLHNALPEFGPLYHLSTPFILIGMIQFTTKLFQEKVAAKKCNQMALWLFLLSAFWAGLATREVNVNRINIIFYPLLFMCAYGVRTVLGWLREEYVKRAGICVMAVYGICAVTFLVSYATDFAQEIQLYFNVNFLELVEEADALTEYDTLYITGNMGWQRNVYMAEILTQYQCRIDPLYYQGRTQTTEGRTLLSYADRYHYVDMREQEFGEENALYILHQTEKDCLPEDYRIVAENESYLAVTGQE